MPDAARPQPAPAAPSAEASAEGSSTASTARPRRGRRATHSLESVLQGAIEILDADGESALTFRALAAHLHTGVGSIYHYVEGRDELLDRATNEILGRVLDHVQANGLPDDPYDALRSLSLDLYTAMQRHRWTAAYLMRDAGMQPSSMRLFDLFGQQVMGLPLTASQQFDAVSSLVSFVIGVGAEMRELPASALVEGRTQAEYLRDFAAAWRALDPDEYPFVHAVADEFEVHDDVAQFRAGVDLLLAGIERQANGA